MFFTEALTGCHRYIKESFLKYLVENGWEIIDVGYLMKRFQIDGIPLINTINGIL